MPRRAQTLNSRERLFLDTLADLESRAATPNRYGLIKASGLLRLLLLDGQPLVHQVNRDYRVKLTFTFHEIPKTDQGDMIVAWVALAKTGDPNEQARTTTGGLDAFLAAGCVGLNGRVLTVRDVIHANAHVKGGVHAGQPQHDGEVGVVLLDQLLKVGDAEASVAALQHIIAVTLKGLQPLTQAVRERNNSRRAT